jgi:predicted MPP superfamily phosphohydrolase
MLAIWIALGGLALFGHAALWVGAVNRWHATGFPRPLVKTVVLAFYFALVTLPVAVAAYLVDGDWSAAEVPRLGELNWATAYCAFCAAYGVVHLPLWAVARAGLLRLPSRVRPTNSRTVDMLRALGASPARGPRTRLLSRLPFNQIWQLQVNEYDVELPRLAEPLAGLSICHLTDLHYCGRIDLGYFHEVVRLSNALAPDLVLLTGDICERRQHIELIAPVLAGLEARLGKFFILGNHDLLTHDVPRLRAAMREAGFVDVAGRYVEIDEGAIVLAGDERPWIKSAPPEEALPDEALRILLAHTPDQLAWARRRGFDLMFAGHTHGGQLRFPLVGPIVCPSWHGTKYACGFFDEPPTLMSVGRGTAGLFPYRLNCPPEITKVVLRRAT